MAALTVPEFPEAPVSVNANQPEVPAPPMGAGTGGKRERETARSKVDLDRSIRCGTSAVGGTGGVAFMARDCRDVQRKLQTLKGTT